MMRESVDPIEYVNSCNMLDYQMIEEREKETNEQSLSLTKLR